MSRQGSLRTGSLSARSPRRAGPPQDGTASVDAAWAAQTSRHLDSASRLRRELASQVDMNKDVELEQKYTDDVNAQLRHNLVTARELTAALDEQIRQVDDTIRTSNAALRRMSKSVAAKCAPTKVCKRRMDLRAQRPVNEHKHDKAHAALEQCYNVWTAGSAEVSQLILQLRECNQKLEESRSELLEDKFGKRKTAVIDHTCLLDGEMTAKIPTDELLHSPRMNEILEKADELPQNAGTHTEPAPVAHPFEGWRARTQQIIDRSVKLCEYTVRLSRESLAMVARTEQEESSISDSVHVHLSRNLVAIKDLTQSLDGQIKSVDQTILKSNDCLLRLRKSRHSKYAQLSVCKRRLELREQRPQQELVQDKAHDALMEEHIIYTQGREKLSQNIEAIKECIISLETAKRDMVDDLHHKRKAHAIDQTCLKLNAKNPIAELDMPQLPQTPTSPQSQDGPPSGSVTPMNGNQPTHSHNDWVTNTRATIADAAKVCQTTLRLNAESMEVMATVDAMCGNATRKSNDVLNAHIKDMNAAKKHLERELKRTEEFIVVANRSQDNLQKKHRHAEVPLQCLNRQFENRHQREDNDHIRDFVHEKLEVHLDACRHTSDHMKAHIEKTKDIKKEMMATRTHLQEALQHKNAALRIDMACMAVNLRTWSAVEWNNVVGATGRGTATEAEESTVEQHRDVTDDFDNEGRKLNSRTGFDLGKMQVSASTPHLNSISNGTVDADGGNPGADGAPKTFHPSGWRMY